MSFSRWQKLSERMTAKVALVARGSAVLAVAPGGLPATAVWFALTRLFRSWMVVPL
jgi:hypothetical protein